MCGRARCSLRADDVPRACGVGNGSVRTVQMDRYRPSYNVSPGYYMPVVHREEGNDGQETVVHCMKWGLIPSFTKKSEKPDHYKMFNARSESICEKASFRRLLPKNRCIVAVEGFYEWKKDGSKKQPYYIHFKDDRPLVLAALYDSWKNPEGEVLFTFTIVTTSCSSALKWLHDRMPVILGDKSSIDAWLNSSTSSGFSSVLKPYEDSDLVWYPVTPAMGKQSFDGPECIKEIRLKTEEKNLISNFFSKKKSDSKEETRSQIKTSPKESAHTDEPESMKQEEENSDLPTDKKVEAHAKIKSSLEESANTDPPKSVKQEENSDLPTDSEVPPLHLGESEKCGTKREYEELISDIKPSLGKTEKLEMSLPKKKGNTKTAGDKQPTLLSYFGRKN